MRPDLGDRTAAGEVQAALAAGEDAWVFGYGSLMWRPGFAYVERSAAVLHGRRRSFCIFSVHHRGAPQRRGLVLGLERGGAVRGAAFRVRAADWPAVHAYLLEREQPTETYVEASVWIRLTGGARIPALTFLSDTSHPQWAGGLGLAAQAQLIAGASGHSGRNVDYLQDLVDHLRAEGVRDDAMQRLLAEVRRLELGPAA
ncbi:MAG TPA: gamma-glutamylcyclotransferase [Caulobacteraceae bacterium]|jgi:cation transport protein ChaC|nr:gamma-glutamylcyclotransferase [Caulobacteraceae bacterium]